MCDERFNEIEKTYIYCRHDGRLSGKKASDRYAPCAWVYHTLDGAAIYEDITGRKETMSRNKAHHEAYLTKHN